MKNFVLVLTALVVAAGGSSRGGMRAKIDSLRRVQVELNRSGGGGEYRVGLTNGTVLTVAAVNSPWQERSSGGRSGRAREIAQVAVRSFGDRAALTRVDVQFVAHRLVLGVISVDRVAESFGFDVGGL